MNPPNPWNNDDGDEKESHIKQWCNRCAALAPDMANAAGITSLIDALNKLSLQNDKTLGLRVQHCRCGMSAQDKIKPDFQKIANDDAEFREITAYSGITVMESHQAWCGPCDCIRPNLWKLSLADESLKFATACSDKVPLLKEYTGKVNPIFFIYKAGKKMATIDGVNGNIILHAANCLIADLLQ